MKKKKNIIWDIDELSLLGWISMALTIILLAIGVLSGSLGCTIFGILAFGLCCYLINRDCKFEDISDRVPNSTSGGGAKGSGGNGENGEYTDERKPKNDVEDRDINEGNEYVQ